MKISGNIKVEYIAECFKPCNSCYAKHLLDGHSAWECQEKELRWQDGFTNIVVTLGRNALLDNTFNAAAGSVNWYVGLKDTGTVAAADTMVSHAGWADLDVYSNATRPAWTKNGAASSGAMSNSSSKASFSINVGDDVYGAFLSSDNTVSGTTGTLFGAGDFAAPRTVVTGDTLLVQVDISIS